LSAIVGVEPSGQQVPAGWSLSLYPTAGEAGGSFRYRQRRWTASGGPAGDPQRARDEAARRARANVRRYCAANGLNRLGTLTYAGAGCHDASALRPDVADFFRRLRRALGNRPLPYLWTAEWHPGGHGLHVHFAVGRYVPQPLIRSTWGRGHVSIKLLGDLPVGASSREEARAAARYLSKYVGKAFDGRRASGLHRYERAQGFGPAVVRLTGGRTADEVVERACTLMGGKAPAVRWSSAEALDWQGPPAIWAQWAG
jgi:hypothetical protein